MSRQYLAQPPTVSVALVGIAAASAMDTNSTAGHRAATATRADGALA